MFTGMADGAIDLTAPIPNTAMVGVWRIDLSNHDKLVGLADDPLAKAAEQAPRN